MKRWLQDVWTRAPRPEPGPYEEPAPLSVGAGLLDGLQDLGRWDELAAEVTREGQGRVVIAGLPQAGKRLLLNRLRGWDMAPVWRPLVAERAEGVAVESYGSFLLADLTEPTDGRPPEAEELLLLLGDPALVLYVIDAGRGVLAIDYRWVATLRAGGRPVLVALNGSDESDETAVAEAARRLGTTVIPIAAASGWNVETALLPALLNTVPRLAVPLGREIQAIRQTAARRIIRQTALLVGILGGQPIPLLDLPFQIMLQSGMVMRVGASFGFAPGGGLNREIMATIAGALAVRYLAQTLVKLVPLLGWAAGGAMAAGSTLLIGEAAIHYYAAGGTTPLRKWLRRQGRPRWLRWSRRPARRPDESAAVAEVTVAAEVQP